MLGVMLTTSFLSMWISNTATTAMMVPIVEAVLREIKNESIKNRLKGDSGNRQADEVWMKAVAGHSICSVIWQRSEKRKKNRSLRGLSHTC